VTAYRIGEDQSVAPSGVFQEGPERISVRVNGQFASEESLKAINLRVNDRFFPLTDGSSVDRRSRA
jgi:multidrug efflux pump